MNDFKLDPFEVPPMIKANYTNEPFTPMEELRFIELLMENNYSVGNALLQFDRELEAKYQPNKGEQ